MTTQEDVRSEVKQWLADNWDPDLPLLDWRRKLVESGWATPTWPAEWFGRGLPGWADPIVHEEFSAVGAVGPAVGGGMGLAAPTLLAHGSDDLKSRLLPRALTGEDTWCQLFSEPGNGSDLAGLATHAERDGDEWVVNGQKLWSTSAHHADLGLLLARTDWDVPKHRGITLLRAADAPARRRGAPGPPDERAPVVQRGVPRPMPVSRPTTSSAARVTAGASRMTTLAFERQFATVRRAVGGEGRVGRADERPPPRPRSTSRRTTGTRSAPAGPTSCSRSPSCRAAPDDPIARQQMAGARRPAAGPRVDRAPGRRPPAPPAGRPGRKARSASSPPAASPRRRRRTHSLSAGADGQLPARRLLVGRGDHRGPAVGAGTVDRRRHRRDPAQHHRREGPRPAARAVRRSRHPLPRDQAVAARLTSWVTWPS